MTRSGLNASRLILPLAGAPAFFLTLTLGGCDRGDPAIPLPQPSASSVAQPAERPKMRPADRGRMIYTSGESSSGTPITARIGDGPPLAATTLACVQCHGVDGRGRPGGA
jgi:hypothetical protein